MNKHVEYLDQHMGAGQSPLSNTDVKFMKTGTIILIGTMILAIKLLTMCTLSMGTLTLECAIFLYSWTTPPYMALVTGVLTTLLLLTVVLIRFLPTLPLLGRGMPQ